MNFLTKGLGLISLVVSVSACTTPGAVKVAQTPIGDVPGASTATQPVRTSMPDQLAKVYTCMKDSGQFNGKIISVADWLDGSQSRSIDGNSHLMARESAASAALSAIKKAGATALDRFNAQSDADLMNLSGKVGHKRINQAVLAHWPDYHLRGQFNTVDFSGGATTDLRVGGIGPKYRLRFAIMNSSVDITRVGSGVLQAEGDMRLIVGYEEAGLSAGRNVNGTLVTGGFTISDQQPLQESAYLLVAPTVADALIDLMHGSARTRCDKMLNDVLESAKKQEDSEA